MNEIERERLESVKERYSYLESHGTVDTLEVYSVDQEDIVADLSFLISLANKDI